MSDYEKGIEAMERRRPDLTPAELEQLADAFLAAQKWGWYCARHRCMGRSERECDTNLTGCWPLTKARIVVQP